MGQPGSIFSRLFGKRRMAGSSPSLELMLQEIEKCGISLNIEADRERLLFDLKPSEWRRGPTYKSLMLRLSGCSPQLHSMYDACIDGPGDYSQALHSLAALTGGTLDLTVVNEEFFTESDLGKPFLPVRIDFKCNDRTFRYDFIQEVDWFNLQLLALLAHFLAGTGSELLFFRVETEDDTITIGCLRLEQIERLASLEGMGRIEILKQILPINGLSILNQGGESV